MPKETDAADSKAAEVKKALGAVTITEDDLPEMIQAVLDLVQWNKLKGGQDPDVSYKCEKLVAATQKKQGDELEKFVSFCNKTWKALEAKDNSFTVFMTELLADHEVVPHKN
eukprot:TRINITY_DN67012_c9_g4_i1.p1 TRINITY_DN67012_c9_g4~~TRINITY_DN67012_c9_g4_i1.p1  ORF type:complete len:112 (+),score=17.64 TRINITY_DN67012_c9_g4_i1:126-461(+)